jgi:hypothetical protein
LASELSWPDVPGASRYRLALLDPVTSEPIDAAVIVQEPRVGLPAADLSQDRPLRATLEAEINDGESTQWTSLGPTARVELTSGPGAGVLRWTGGPVNRLTVVDRTAARTLFDDAVLGTVYRLELSPEEEAHDIRYRTHTWDPASSTWTEASDWRHIPLAITLGEPRDPPAPIDPQAPPGLLLLFTIDTECSVLRQRNPDPATVVDELILGTYGDGRELGIGLHMDLLEHFGYRGCFFVDVLMEYAYGQEALERTIAAIAERGHEIELHVHADHLWWSPDPDIAGLVNALGNDWRSFRRVMELSIDLFERRVGQRPTAYRAGGFRIRDEHITVLQELGIPIDSSIQSYFHTAVDPWMRTRTQPFRLGPLLELPVTWFLVHDTGRDPDPRAFAPNATAGDPVSLMPAGEGVPEVVNYVSHSFQLLRAERERGSDVREAFRRRLEATAGAERAEGFMRGAGENLIFRDGTLDEELVSVMAGLLRRVADRPDARCITFTELHEAAAGWWSGPRDRPVDPLPVINRRSGAVTVRATRIYSAALLRSLCESQRGGPRVRLTAASLLERSDLPWHGLDVAVLSEDPAEPRAWLERNGAKRVTAGEDLAGQDLEPDAVVWLDGFETTSSEQLKSRVAAVLKALSPSSRLLVRVRTLGVSGDDALPALAELLFPRLEIETYLAGADATPHARTLTWDLPGVRTWLESQGLAVTGAWRIPTGTAEASAIAGYPDKLSSLDPEELHCAAVDILATPAGSVLAGRPRPDAGLPSRAATQRRLIAAFPVIQPDDVVLEAEPGRSGTLGDVLPSDRPGEVVSEPLDDISESNAAAVAVCAAGVGSLGGEHVDQVAESIYAALRPGGELLARLGAARTVPTVTVQIIALQRAGFELISIDHGEEMLARFSRPIGNAEIEAYGGS